MGGVVRVHVILGGGRGGIHVDVVVIAHRPGAHLGGKREGGLLLMVMVVVVVVVVVAGHAMLGGHQRGGRVLDLGQLWMDGANRPGGVSGDGSNLGIVGG